MSEKTNELLQLFSRLLHSPRFMTALHMEMLSEKLKNRGKRNGAQGLMVELWIQDGLTNSEISEQLDIKPSSVTAQVKNLEEDGYVERRQDENDKRVSRVYLTKKGRLAYEKRIDFRDNIGKEIFDVLTDEEQVQLDKLINKLVEANKDEKFDCENIDFSLFGLKGGRFPFQFSPIEMHDFAEQMRKVSNRAVADMRKMGEEIHHGNQESIFKERQNNSLDSRWPYRDSKNAKNSKKESEEWNEF